MGRPSASGGRRAATRSSPGAPRLRVPWCLAAWCAAGAARRTRSGMRPTPWRPAARPRCSPEVHLPRQYNRSVGFSTEPLPPAASRRASTRKTARRCARDVRSLPADERRCRYRSLPARDLGQRRRSVARLARQAQVLKPLPPHLQRCRPGHAPALVADKDGRIHIGPTISTASSNLGRSRSGRPGWRCARDRRRSPHAGSQWRRLARGGAPAIDVEGGRGARAGHRADRNRAA